MPNPYRVNDCSTKHKCMHHKKTYLYTYSQNTIHLLGYYFKVEFLIRSYIYLKRCIKKKK